MVFIIFISTTKYHLLNIVKLFIFLLLDYEFTIFESVRHNRLNIFIYYFYS